MVSKLHQYRFEYLFFALVMAIFSKIAFTSSTFFSAYVWPFNMFLLGVASLGIFKERRRVWAIALQSILFTAVIAVPLFAKRIFASSPWSLAALATYMLFYSLIFIEVFRQITQKSEVTESIILGSLCGFLLLVIVATFGFLLQNHLHPGAFPGVNSEMIPEIYHQITYFSIITLTTIGFGDITPATDQARLLTGFWGIAGQFYMIAIVGIIISKFTAK